MSTNTPRDLRGRIIGTRKVEPGADQVRPLHRMDAAVDVRVPDAVPAIVHVLDPAVAGARQPRQGSGRQAEPEDGRLVPAVPDDLALAVHGKRLADARAGHYAQVDDAAGRVRSRYRDELNGEDRHRDDGSAD
jgi:hypothetical protein